MINDNAAGRRLLGTVGWERPDWLAGYYPADLPADWRLAYYANDCGCVLLPASAWCSGDPGRLERAVGEAPADLRIFLQAATPMPRDLSERAEILAAQRAVLLVEQPGTDCPGLPQWVAQGVDLWVDTDSDARLVRWSIDAFDLRGLRSRAEVLEPRVQALVLDGPGAVPGRIPELRVMLELMGKA